VAAHNAGIAVNGDYTKKIVARVEASLIAGVRWPDEPTNVFGVDAPPATSTTLIGGAWAQFRGRVQQVMDGVRSAQQQWHANPLVCAGVYPNDLDLATKTEYAAQHQVPLEMDGAVKLKGRVTNKQLRDTMIIQSRTWFCGAIRAMKGYLAADEHNERKDYFKTGWFYIGNILHTIQDSYSEAHTERVCPHDFEDNNGDYKGRCTNDLMREMVVNRFLGMDFTKYSKHKPADNVKGKDRWRDCARQASKGLIALFKPFSDKALAGQEITREIVITAIKALTAFLRDDVWSVAYPDRPAGGSTELQGTAPIILGADQIITEAELEDYIRDHIRAQGDSAALAEAPIEQKNFLRRYKYAARTPERRVLDGSSQYYHQFTMADNDDAFNSCENIILYEHPQVQLLDLDQIIPDEPVELDVDADEPVPVVTEDIEWGEQAEMMHDRQDEIFSDETSLLH